MGIEGGRLHRRSIRLKGFDYTRAGAYFVTIVTHDRLSLFGEVVGGDMRFSPFGVVARQQWECLPHRFLHIGLDEFVVMPNHVHGIIMIYDDDGMGTADLPDTRRGTADLPDTRWGTADLANTRWGTADLPDTRRGTAVRSNDRGCEPSRRAPTDPGTLEQFGKPVPGSIPTIIRSYKSAVAYRLNLIRRTPGADVWQRNYYERIIRDEAEYHRIARYIIENPAQWETDDESRPQENYHA
jgi:REP element-mobilizing transposase RayT